MQRAGFLPACLPERFTSSLFRSAFSFKPAPISGADRPDHVCEPITDASGLAAVQAIHRMFPTVLYSASSGEQEVTFSKSDLAVYDFVALTERDRTS